MNLLNHPWLPLGLHWLPAAGPLLELACMVLVIGNKTQKTKHQVLIHLQWCLPGFGSWHLVPHQKGWWLGQRQLVPPSNVSSWQYMYMKPKPLWVLNICDVNANKYTCNMEISCLGWSIGGSCPGWSLAGCILGLNARKSKIKRYKSTGCYRHVEALSAMIKYDHIDKLFQHIC